MKLLLLFIILWNQFSFSQYPHEAKVHSHNDYKQEKPFWAAYEAEASSIEVDIVLARDTLFVCHHKDEIISERTIESLYLQPMEEILSIPSDSTRKLQLLIDIKSEAKPTLDKLIEVFGKYESLRKNNQISFVISGNRPPVEAYVNYPDFILFDYQSLSNIKTSTIWEKIALISLPFHKYSKWNGKTNLSPLEAKKIQNVIAKAHKYGKPFRFWATPDTKFAWKTLSKNGVDFINTDHPYECSKFLNSIKKEHP